MGAALQGKSGRMMVFERTANGKDYFCKVNDSDITGAANNVKKVPDEFISQDGTYVNDKCIEYLMPLIMGECDVKYRNGIPAHFVF